MTLSDLFGEAHRYHGESSANVVEALKVLLVILPCLGCHESDLPLEL